MKKVLVLLLLLAAGIAQAASDTIRVACVGNSITYGHGINNRMTDSYPAQLERMLGVPWQVRNFGFSGRTLLLKGDSPYMKEAMYQDALAYLPHVVVIKLGTNDSKPQNWKFSAYFKQDLTTLVESFQKLSSKPRVFLCYPAKAFSESWGIRDSVIYNGVIPYVKAVANQTGCPIIDLYTPTTSVPELFPDNIHPNAAGAKLLAEVVAKALLADQNVQSLISKK